LESGASILARVYILQSICELVVDPFFIYIVIYETSFRKYFR